ncbi:probable inactive histone-lysine N-methyltransferase SUVR2 [Pyrus x bretschneideri]|uniref:probable inactive histone-lysine N-methyltransferase SUVR2 n=1 Tax=Pyrus x bretschneideri TaxID=225117 RepID=UPI00202F2E6E|nr:probable inactive histone-lysine N-methyltransferase SUVR2 [Pyrus x bretschneideri]
MAPNPRVNAAFKAMAELGINEKQVKPVLKNLLRLFDKNWELIEEENYRVLVDAIFDAEDTQGVEEKKEKKKSKNYDEEDMEEEPQLRREPARPSKRIHSSGDEGSSQKKKSTNTDPEDNIGEELPLPHQPERPLKRLRKTHGGQLSPSPSTCNPMLGGPLLIRPKVEKDELLTRSPDSRAELHQPVSPHLSNKNKGKQPVASNPVPQHGKRITESGIVLLPKHRVDNHQLMKPKDEPFTDDMAQDEVPIAVILPDPSSKEKPPLQNGATGEQNDQEPVASQERESTRNDIVSSSNERNTNFELATLEEESSNLEVASSPLGEDGSISASPNLDALKKTTAWDSVHGTKETLCMQPCSLNGPVGIECPTAVTAPEIPRLPLSLNGVGECRQAGERADSNGFAEVDKEGELEDSRGLVVVQHCDLPPDDLRSYHDIDDITKGEERVKIPWLNEKNNEYPPSFFYISRSLVFQDAAINLRLSGIGDANCCPTCFGDCLSASVPCACASQTEGDFAYTQEGLLRDDFLEECISMIRNPQQHRPFYCKSCPLERVKNDDCLEPCKGHLRRQFIKECWSKCGCHRQCGNRVVQRGLNCKLQVFFTSEGKGWGLRTLEDLPKGAFVCEYVGEVLTSKELHERNIKSSRSGKRPYPVRLDANWASKADLRDKEALCLDATNYGNVARFINHRCLDANLVEIPVEVESPDHCYYHLAFFTTRKVDALEELTWDYGIDFDDHDHPVKVFQCQCGSKFCRNMKRSNRSRSGSIAR